MASWVIVVGLQTMRIKNTLGIKKVQGKSEAVV